MALVDILLENISVVLPATGRRLFDLKRLEIEKGSRVLIQGPSGVGKTTLLHLIAGLFIPDRGEVTVDGHQLTRMNEAARSRFRRQHYGVIFQKLNLIDHLTGLENVRLGLFDRNDGLVKAQTALNSVHMEDLARGLTGYLSLGEQQRIAVARVLAARPSIALADEPISSLDQENAQVVMDALFSLPEESTLIVVSHDHRIAPKFTRVLQFKDLVTA